MTRSIHQEILGLQISMNVTEFVKFVDAHEHFSRVETSVFFLEDTRVVEERAEVTAWNVFLRVDGRRQRQIPKSLPGGSRYSPWPNKRDPYPGKHTTT